MSAFFTVSAFNACYFLLFAMAALLCLALILLFRKLGLSDSVNYFYAMDPTSNPVLELFWSWIPVPGLYLLPAAGIVVPYLLGVTAIFQKKKK